MEEYFEKFIDNISLTSKQKKDAKKKYSNACKIVHEEFYDSKYDGSTKFLFGSYKKKTAIRPMSKDQDVDVLFKIPEDIFEQYQDNKNGQSDLLQKIRSLFDETKYSLGEKPRAWGKVILITTADGSHNVELLPAFEKEDESFVIPNTENGGSWDSFDPRKNIEEFENSNSKTNGLTRDLIKMVKRWKQENKTLNLKSYVIDKRVIKFLEEYKFNDYPTIIFDVFVYLNLLENSTFIQSARDRSEKAMDYLEEGKINKAVSEYRKIFGDSFPLGIHKNLHEQDKYIKAPNEEFIEEKFEIRKSDLKFEIDCEVEQDGFRKGRLSNFIGKLRKRKSLTFFIKENDFEKPYEIRWKVRNVGKDARNDLRGEIVCDEGKEQKIENTKYSGEHYVECYLIQNNVCRGISRINVPISNF